MENQIIHLESLVKGAGKRGLTKKQELSNVTVIRRLTRWRKHAERQDKEEVPENIIFMC